MRALAAVQPLGKLADALAVLDRKPRLDDAERLTRAVLFDVITERCPAADVAFQAWADSDDNNQHHAVQAIVTAVKGSVTAAKRDLGKGLDQAGEG